ncbi:MAG: hypothetical protein M3R14_12700 [Acidobacteriota bacterium]|nr:hypothetical protein [Acidobacteriota bacterium]
MAPRIDGNNIPAQTAQTRQTPSSDGDEVIRVETCIQRDKPVNQQPVSSCELAPQSNSSIFNRRNELALYGQNRRNQIERTFEEGSSILGNTAKGVEVDKLLPRRYQLEPPRGDTVTGLRDTSAGRVRGNPPKPVGDWLIRFDVADKRTTYPHINMNPRLTGVPDPHTQISPTTLKFLGGSARTLEAFGRVARPVALVTDTIRLGSAFSSDGNQIGRNTQITAGSVAGGWAGAAAGGLAGAKGGAIAGAFVGAFFGGVGAVPGAAIGGFIGGLAGSIGGAFVGSSLGESVAESIVDAPR